MRFRGAGVVSLVGMDKTLPVRALVLPAGADEAREEQVAANDLKQMQRLVGGWLESLDLTTGVAIYFNEEGKRAGLPDNPLANRLVFAANPGLLHGDSIVGDAVLVGIGVDPEEPERGEVCVDLPEAGDDLCARAGVTIRR